MTTAELVYLYNLLTKWIAHPSWNRADSAWANIVETRRQVEIELTERDPDWRETFGFD